MVQVTLDVQEHKNRKLNKTSNDKQKMKTLP